MIRKIKFGIATKFALTFVLLLSFTMAIVYYAVHQIVEEEFTRDYRRNVQSSLIAIQKEISNRQQTIKHRLRELAIRLSDDNDFRLHLSVLDDIHHRYILDYAGTYMKTMGLDALEITNREGLVLSSGHHRNAFGRNALPRIRQLQSGGGKVLWFERVSDRFPALASLDSLSLGNQKLYVIGGIQISSGILRTINQDSTNSLVARFDTLLVSSSPVWENFSVLKRLNFDVPEDSLPAWIHASYTVGYFQMPMVTADTVIAAEFVLFHPKSGLTMLLENMRKNMLIIFGVGIFIAIVLSIWRARVVTNPLSRLASAASNISFENLEFNFNSNYSEEVGALSQALHRMVGRLRQSRIELAAAEQKAARAEIARQVSHDLKNGFLPIRHVLEHWEEIAATDPQKLVEIFNERKATVKESLKYLEELSRSYTKIQSVTKPVPLRINELLQRLVENYRNSPEDRIRFEFEFDSSDPVIHADKVQLRRAFENILRNAIEAIKEEGVIVVSTEAQGDKVIVAFRDTGCGIPEPIKDILFTTSVSTKSDGTGIGLINVKGIIEDLGGSICIESNNGKGTTVEIALPVAQRK